VLPGAIAETIPALSTVATLGFDDFQVTELVRILEIPSVNAPMHPLP
jgi:hypothetical protein